MNPFSFIFPKKIADVYSSINGRIIIYKFWGDIYFSVDGLSQSGGLVKNIWEKALQKLKTKNFEPRTILVLGVGGGTVINLINKYFPDAHVTGIEIDKTMIYLGKKYLQLNEIKKTDIIIDDAYNWINEKKYGNSRYDLILVDMYIGKHVPVELNDEKFLEKMKHILSEDGLIVFNRLRNNKNKEKIGDFIEILKKIFSRVSVETPIANYIIFCS